MALTVNVNCDTQDLPLGTSGVDWVEMNLVQDSLIFSAGSNVVKDGEPNPSSSDLTQAGTVLTASAQVVAHTFLNDISAALLKEIHNAGNNNKRYVFCFEFDAATASEPVLEMWDDSDMDTFDIYSLGEGVANDSWWWGITTTSALPGANWLGTTPTAGSKLAGSSDGHFLWLNDEAGALTGATNLYCNLKIVVPASFATGANETPILVVKYTGN